MIFQCESVKILVIYYCQCSPLTNQLILVSMPKSRVDKQITDMLTLIVRILFLWIYNYFINTKYISLSFISNFYGDD